MQTYCIYIKAFYTSFWPTRNTSKVIIVLIYTTYDIAMSAVSPPLHSSTLRFFFFFIDLFTFHRRCIDHGLWKRAIIIHMFDSYYYKKGLVLAEPNWQKMPYPQQKKKRPRSEMTAFVSGDELNLHTAHVLLSCWAPKNQGPIIRDWEFPLLAITSSCKERKRERARIGECKLVGR